MCVFVGFAHRQFDSISSLLEVRDSSCPQQQHSDQCCHACYSHSLLPSSQLQKTSLLYQQLQESQYLQIQQSLGCIYNTKLQ